MSKDRLQRDQAWWDSGRPDGCQWCMSVVGFLVCFEWDSFKRKWMCEEGKENAVGKTEAEGKVKGRAWEVEESSEFEVKGLREGRSWREGQSAQGRGSPTRALPHQAGMALCPSQSSAKSLCASCLILLGGDATQLVTSHKYTYKWCCRV